MRYTLQCLMSFQPSSSLIQTRRVALTILHLLFLETAFALAAPLHHLFITSINNGIIPTERKIHKIVPVYKSEGKMSVKNYRSISLLCSVSKVLEGLIYDRVISIVASSIIQCQFGFQRNTSTQQQLLIYFHQLVTSLAETGTVYIDFRKAFDSVPHNELLLKLWNIGITGSLWK